MPSFCRQLNNHGFTARHQDVYGRGSHRYCFGHENFVLHDKGRLKEIALVRKPQPTKAASRQRQVRPTKDVEPKVKRITSASKAKGKRQYQANEDDIYGKVYSNRSSRSPNAESEKEKGPGPVQEKKRIKKEKREQRLRTPSPEPFEPMDPPEHVIVEMVPEQKAASLFLHMVHSAHARANVLTNKSPTWYSVVDCTRGSVRPSQVIVGSQNDYYL
jgi:hypothetical protein